MNPFDHARNALINGDRYVRVQNMLQKATVYKLRQSVRFP